MSIETPSFDTPQDEEEILEIAQDAMDVADPTTYSALPPEEMNKKIFKPISEFGTPAYKGSDGETYFRLNERQNPRGQQAVARMLKGVLNVSDIVVVPDAEGNDVFYSRKIPIEKIEENGTAEDMEADQMLLRYLFNSEDHRFQPSNDFVTNGRFENGKINHFDFGEDTKYFFENNNPHRNVLAQLPYLSSETIARMRNKVAQLRQRFDGAVGKDFVTALEASGGGDITELIGSKADYAAVPEGSTSIEFVRDTLLKRLGEIDEQLNALSIQSNQQTA